MPRQLRLVRRGLLLHDVLAFALLSLAAIALFVVTLGLFRSFMARREDLGREWTARGEAALRSGHPGEAVDALRVALTYAPDEEKDQLLLAEALAAAGRTDEASSYFLNLWVARPGDGNLNLQLARLARRRGDAVQATESYRAAIFGSWAGDGLSRRRTVRLELADYLAERHDLPGARAELLTGAGNAPDDPPTDIFFGDRLLAVKDSTDALTYYRKALADDPRNVAALERAGRVSFMLGDYERAATLLTRAVREKAVGHQEATPQTGLEMLAHDAARMVELNLSRELPARTRAAHLAVAGALALARLNGCAATLSPHPEAGSIAPTTTLPLSLAELKTRWKVAADPAARRALATDAAAQDARMQLIFDTERETAAACGAPAGDDALLLTLARAGTDAESRPE